jgi:chaperonin cofactor prefoldin
MQITMDSVSSRQDQVEERISEMENKIQELLQANNNLKIIHEYIT